jgi:hypothetical protein
MVDEQNVGQLAGHSQIWETVGHITRLRCDQLSKLMGPRESGITDPFIFLS